MSSYLSSNMRSRQPGNELVRFFQSTLLISAQFKSFVCPRTIACWRPVTSNAGDLSLHARSSTLDGLVPSTSVTLHPPARLKMPLRQDNVSPLMQFYENGLALPKFDLENKPVYGRSWRASELRCKSFQDLHKLWYVCLKERNLLATQHVEAKRQRKMWFGVHRVVKCKETMARIKQVLSERSRLYLKAVQLWKRQHFGLPEEDKKLAWVERMIHDHKRNNRLYRKTRRFYEKRHPLF